VGENHISVVCLVLQYCLVECCYCQRIIPLTFIMCCITLTGTTMLNGYLPGDGHNKSSTDESPGSDAAVGCSPVATLCNLGNTCFLNSVIYTLRFAPAFLHNLHHLADDLGDLTSKQQQVKVCRCLICLSNALCFYVCVAI
jgi:hypothetical protein